MPQARLVGRDHRTLEILLERLEGGQRRQDVEAVGGDERTLAEQRRERGDGRLIPALAAQKAAGAVADRDGAEPHGGELLAAARQVRLRLDGGATIAPARPRRA